MNKLTYCFKIKDFVGIGTLFDFQFFLLLAGDLEQAFDFSLHYL